MDIKILAGPVTLEAELHDTPTGKMVFDMLPVTTPFSTWGDEIYFSIPVESELDETAREEVALGDLGYWPPGKAFCIFFWPHPHEHTRQDRSGKRRQHYWKSQRRCSPAERGHAWATNKPGKGLKVPAPYCRRSGSNAKRLSPANRWARLNMGPTRIRPIIPVWAKLSSIMMPMRTRGP